MIILKKPHQVFSLAQSPRDHYKEVQQHGSHLVQMLYEECFRADSESMHYLYIARRYEESSDHSDADFRLQDRRWEMNAYGSLLRTMELVEKRLFGGR